MVPMATKETSKKKSELSNISHNEVKDFVGIQ